MRSLFVAILVGLLVFGVPAHATLLAPKAGDTITQTDLLNYLFVPPQTGDWLTYRVSVNDNQLLVKTVGFGVETIRDQNSAYFETQTQTSGLLNIPVQSHTVAGGNLIWKMYVDAPNFNDNTHLYSFVAGIIKIGDALFRLGLGPTQPLSPSYHEPLQTLLLYGTLPLPDDRSGLVVSSAPEDMDVSGRTLHTVHTIVDFPARSIGMANGLPQERLETWQTADVPLGLVTLRLDTNGNRYTMKLIAYGRGDFHSAINSENFENIPYFPG